MSPSRKDEQEPLFGRESLFRQKLNELRTTGHLSQIRQASTQARSRELEQLGYLHNVKDAIDHSDPKEMQRRTLLDSLTEFYNNATIVRVINDEFKRSKRYKRPLTIVSISIDNFDEIEAGYGRIVSDSVLKGVANFVMKQIRDVDIPGRYDLKTLLIVCPETDPAGVAVLAERMRTKIRQDRVSDAAQNWFVTLSQGIASSPTPLANKSEDLINLARTAMDRARVQGGDAFEMVK